MAPEPDAWQVWYFQREQGGVPALEFLDSLPRGVHAKFRQTLLAVATAPPPAFKGSRYWQVMHDEMSGFYEVRLRSGKLNHRLMCVLENPGRDLGGPSVVCIGGFTKKLQSAAHPREYERLRRYRDEFLRTRAVVS